MTRARGWLPDPTRRHELRFWDGDVWTADVSDGTTVSFDPGEVPVTPPPPDPATPAEPPWPTTPDVPDLGGEAATALPSPSRFSDPATVFSTPAPAPTPPLGGPGAGPAPAPLPSPGPSAATSPSVPGPGPAHGPGPGGATDRSSRLSPWVVGAGVVLVAALAVAGFLVIRAGQDDDRGPGDASLAGGSTTTSGSGGGAGDGATTGPGGSSGSGSSAGADNLDEFVVAAVAHGIVEGSDGAIDEDEAVCMGQELIDEIGIDRLGEVTQATAEEPGTNPLDLLSDEERTAAMTRMRACVDQATLDSLSPSTG